MIDFASLPPACREARETMHDRLDGPLPAERAARLADHVAGCAECREHDRGLLEVRRGLAELPELRFPDDALEQVWDRTIRARPAPRLADWRVAVAAGVLLAALVGAWIGAGRERGASPVTARSEVSAEEVALAEQQLRLVLGRTAGALKRAERAAVRGVLADEVSPALRRIPIRWPDSQPGPVWRNGT